MTLFFELRSLEMSVRDFALDVNPENVLVAGWSFPVKFPWLGEEWKRMEALEFTEAQKAFIIKQSEDGTTVAEIFRKAGINQATYHNWKERCGRRDVPIRQAPAAHVRCIS